jgi:phage gp36-like protein
LSYASLADLVARAGESEILQIADRDDDGVADSDVIAKALTDADNIVDARLAARYQVPLSTTPAIVNGWAVSIARYFLHRDGAPDHVVRDYNNALSDLKDAAAGKFPVPDASGIEPSGGHSDSVRVYGDCPAFSKDKLEGWL